MLCFHVEHHITMVWQWICPIFILHSLFFIISLTQYLNYVCMQMCNDDSWNFFFIFNVFIYLPTLFPTINPLSYLLRFFFANKFWFVFKIAFKHFVWPLSASKSVIYFSLLKFSNSYVKTFCGLVLLKSKEALTWNSDAY